MRLLRKNRQHIEYYPNLGVEEVIEDGRHTGRFVVKYGDPVVYHGNVAASMMYDRADMRWYGVETTYLHTIVLDDVNADIKETGKIVWNGNDYEVKEVAPSLNVLRIQIRKMVSNNAEAVTSGV